MKKAVAALTALVEQHDTAGALDQKAETSALLATALRIEAGLAAEQDRRAAFFGAYTYALKSRDHAIEAATKGGVNTVNTVAYVRATDESGQCSLAVGDMDLSADATKLLAEAADYFGEAAAGYRRLGCENDAKIAGMKALEARSKHALRN